MLLSTTDKQPSVKDSDPHALRAVAEELPPSEERVTGGRRVELPALGESDLWDHPNPGPPIATNLDNLESLDG